MSGTRSRRANYKMGSPISPTLQGEMGSDRSSITRYSDGWKCKMWTLCERISVYICLRDCLKKWRSFANTKPGLQFIFVFWRQEHLISFDWDSWERNQKSFPCTVFFFLFFLNPCEMFLTRVCSGRKINRCGCQCLWDMFVSPALEKYITICFFLFL